MQEGIVKIIIAKIRDDDLLLKILVTNET